MTGTAGKFFLFRMGLFVSILFATPKILSAAAILPNALPTIQLSGSTPSINADNTGSIAYHPGFQKYYGAHIGSTSFNGYVWDTAGALVQTKTLGTDVRALNYNPNTNAVEIVSYAAQYMNGLYTLGLDGSGQLTGNNPLIFGPLPGMNGDQTIPAYDPVRNRFYSRNTGGTVNVVDRNSGTLINTINLNLAAAGNPTLQLQTIGYDAARDLFITVDVANPNQLRALVFDISGAYLGASVLPAGIPYSNQYCMGYANGQLFISQANRVFTYRGFQIFAVPEPAAISLLFVGGCMFAALARRNGRNRNSIQL